MDAMLHGRQAHVAWTLRVPSRPLWPVPAVATLSWRYGTHVRFRSRLVAVRTGYARAWHLSRRTAGPAQGRPGLHRPLRPPHRRTDRRLVDVLRAVCAGDDGRPGVAAESVHCRVGGL